jgi:phage terminase large subunit
MNAQAPIPEVTFSEKMQCIFSDKRYIVLYGGRGAGRSWGVAQFLLLQGFTRPITVLCARELQKSIDESVHKVLRKQIGRLGLTSEYEVQRDKIYGPVDEVTKAQTEFSFIGVKTDPAKVKSFEDIDYCWVEEANKVSAASWNELTPTVRKKGSKIIMTFNPELKSDYTYRTFVTDALRDATPVICRDPESPMFGQVLWHETDDSVICKMSYEDNPWFFEDTELPADMEKDKRRDEDKYLNVWMGFPKENLEGAIYAKELRRAQVEDRICAVPWFREIPVDTFWDLGRADFTCIWFAQRVAMQWRVLDFLSGQLEELSYYIKELQRREYVYGTHYLPHDGKAKKLGSKHTIQEQLALAWPRKVQIVPLHNVVDGINAVREMFPQCWFDEARCADGIQGLRHYRYRVIDGQLSGKPLHDGSDPADAFRTMAMARRLPRDSDATIVLAKLRPKFVDRFEGAMRSVGWME